MWGIKTSPLLTSPRLWGEVGIRALARIPGEGARFQPGGPLWASRKGASHPDPLPASEAREINGGMVVAG
jgi:hypothetical protein